MRTNFDICGISIPPGTGQGVVVPVSVTSDHTPVGISVYVQHGARSGPTVMVSAAVHGDEIIGVEIVRRLLQSRKIKRLSGTLMAIPIVNTLGFINRSRYLPDRRDLNRSFPGSQRGSLAARLAHIFLSEILQRADVAIDLHSAAIHRSNLPQIRIPPENERLLALADTFGAPVVLTSKTRPGSLRQAAHDAGVDLLLFEAGEALRFDELAVRAGVRGVMRVLAHLGMIGEKGLSKPRVPPFHASSATWVRAPAGGLIRTYKTIGDVVTQDTILGAIADPFGVVDVPIKSPAAGLVIGRTNLPLINEGDALFHIARIVDADPGSILGSVEQYSEAEEIFDEDEII